MANDSQRLRCGRRVGGTGSEARKGTRGGCQHRGRTVELQRERSRQERLKAELAAELARQRADQGRQRMDQERIEAERLVLERKCEEQERQRMDQERIDAEAGEVR